MIKTRLTGKNAIASVLLGIYAAFWLAWVLHPLITPEHRHEQKICLHDPNETHLHSEEYASPECSICQLVSSQAPPADREIQKPDAPKPSAIRPFWGESFFLSVSLNSLAQPRAPPVRLA